MTRAPGRATGRRNPTAASASDTIAAAWHPSAVLFDAAGTLIELVESVGDTYARFAHAHDVRLPADRIQAAWRRASARSEARVFPGANPDEAATLERQWWLQVVTATFRDAAPAARFRDFQALFSALFQHFAGRDAWRLRDGVIPMLSTLQQRGLRLGIVSNFDHRLPMLLQLLEISSFFESIAIPSGHGVAKPDAKLFEAGLNALGSDPADAVYIGDDPRLDLAAARALGMRTIDAARLTSLAELPARLATLHAQPR